MRVESIAKGRAGRNRSKQEVVRTRGGWSRQGCGDLRAEESRWDAGEWNGRVLTIFGRETQSNETGKERVAVDVYKN